MDRPRCGLRSAASTPLPVLFPSPVRLTKGSPVFGTFQFDFSGTYLATTTYTVATFGPARTSARRTSVMRISDQGLTGSFAIVGGTQLQFTVNPTSLTISSRSQRSLQCHNNQRPPIADVPVGISQTARLSPGPPNPHPAGEQCGQHQLPAPTPARSPARPVRFPPTQRFAVIVGSTPGYLTNLSARANVGIGANVLIAGLSMLGRAWRRSFPL